MNKEILLGATMRTQKVGVEVAKRELQNENFIYFKVKFDNILSKNEEFAMCFIDKVYGGLEVVDRTTLEDYFDFESYKKDNNLGADIYDWEEVICDLSDRELQSYFNFECLGIDLNFTYTIDVETSLAINNIDL